MRHRIQRTGDIVVVTFGEHRRHHRIEKPVVLKEEKGNERDGEDGDGRRDNHIDDRREDRVERIEVDQLAQGRRQSIGQREGALGLRKQRLQVELRPRQRLLDRRYHRSEIDIRELVNLVEDQRDEERAQGRHHHPDDHQRDQRPEPARHSPTTDA